MKNGAALVAIGLLIGLVAGLAIGMGMNGRTDSPEPRVSVDEDTRPHKPSGDVDDAAVDGPESEGQPDGSELQSRSSTTPDGLADIMAATEIPDIPTGNAALHGRVRTLSGEPLAGVKVTAWLPYPDERLTGDDMAARVLDDIRYEKWRANTRKSATTDANGDYRIGGLSARHEYGIYAEKSAWKVEHTNTDNHRVKPEAEVNFKATAVVKVTFVVRMPDGSLAESAYISCELKGEYATSISVEDGTASRELETGHWVFNPRAGDESEYNAEDIELEIQPGDAPHKVDIQLAVRPGIRGRVSIPDIYAGSWAHIRLQKDPPATPPTGLPSYEEEYESTNTLGAEEFTTEHRYRLLGVQPGRYRVFLEHQDQLVDWRDVTIGDDILELNFEVPEPDREDYIVIKAWGPDGKLTEDYRTSLFIITGHGSSSWGADEIRHPSGEHWVRRAELEGNGFHGRSEVITEWMYRVTIKSDEYGELKKDYAHDDTHVLEFRFQIPAHVNLTIDNHNDHEYRKRFKWSVVNVGADGEQLGYWDAERGEQDDESPFEFGPLVPGRYDVVLMFTYKHSELELVRKTVDLLPGDNQVHASIPALHELKVRVSEEDNADHIRIMRGKRELDYWGDETPVHDGIKTFPFLTPGNYELIAPRGRMKVTVPAGGVVEFVPLPYDCLRLYHIKEGGLVEALGLRDGDKLVAVDGEDDFTKLKAKLMLSVEADSTTWTVIRNGVEVEVTFSGKELKRILKNRSENDEDFDMQEDYING